MPADTVPAEPAAPNGLRWSPAKVLLIACTYAAPLGLLCLRLHQEMLDGTLPTDGGAVLTRFIVVGLFSLLLSRWCVHWIKHGRPAAHSRR
jgi:hypothetical protein